MSEYVKCGPRTELRPELPNWQIFGLSFSHAEHAGIACPGCWIDDRDECVGIEPLLRSGHGNAGIGSLAIERHARNPVGIVRNSKLDGLRRIRRLENAIAVRAILPGLSTLKGTPE